MGLLTRARVTTAAIAVGCLLLGIGLGSCGLGRNDTHTGSIADPVVAATVNGRPIYIEDVRSRAVQLGRLREGEDLNANSDAFYLTLEELIQFRLFSMEAEARGLDRDADVRRHLEIAREQVLASAIYDEIDQHANNTEAIQRLYRENTSQLNQGQEIHLRHIQFASMESAQAAKRRLDRGEQFEALAYTLSQDTETGADGGDLGFRSVSDLAPTVRQAVGNVSIGQVVGPIQIGETWHLLRVDDLRERGAPSIETLRPRIIEWLRFKEISELEERLERNARIVRLREPEGNAEPGGEVTAPADSPTPVERERPTPDIRSPSGQAVPPAFPFPMGPGGVSGGPPNPSTGTTTPPPAAPRPTATPPAAPRSTTTTTTSTSTTTAVPASRTTTTTTPRPTSTTTTQNSDAPIRVTP